MPRIARSAVRGFAYHVFNRGNDKRQLFAQDLDYRLFLRLMRSAPRCADIGLLAYCLLPNHWHLVAMPHDLEALSAYVQWVTGTHGLRWRRSYGRDAPGHVYQGRFKSVPILTDQHLLTVLRYVEANPVRAGLVTSARAWAWSSRAVAADSAAPPLATWPWPVPSNWDRQLDQPQPADQLDAIRRAIRRGTPLEDAGAKAPRLTPSEPPPGTPQAELF